MPRPLMPRPLIPRPLHALSVLLALTLPPTLAAASAPLTVQGQITFFNDSGTFLLDLGGMGVGKTLAGKLTGVQTLPGTMEWIKKTIPTGALVKFTVLKPGAYPEGTLSFAGKDVGALLIAAKLANPPTERREAPAAQRCGGLLNVPAVR